MTSSTSPADVGPVSRWASIPALIFFSALVLIVGLMARNFREANSFATPAMLLPLTGDASLTDVGISMQNGAQLAMDFIASNPNMTDNITISVKDTGADAGGAADH